MNMPETHRPGNARARRGRWVYVGAAAAALLAAVPAHARPAAPTAPAVPPPVPVQISPAEGAVVEALPAFAWAPAPGADRYEFDIAADPGFNSPVLGPGLDQFATRNTRATLKKTVPNGRYWWRVRSVGPTGEVSPWTAGRMIHKAWNTAPTPLTPPNHVVIHPNPLELRWTLVPGARNYLVSIATDPQLGSLVGGKPYETEATSFIGGPVLAPGTYYWAVTPADGSGNHGARSPVASFTWVWPSDMSNLRVTDLIADAEVFDPQFSWDPVAGAVKYEVEVYSAAQPALKVCCTGASTGTSLAPKVLFPDNRYLWRVRAIDGADNAGKWNDGPIFEKSFDGVPPVAGTSIKNLRMLTGFRTNTPIVAWDPVPGASSYLVEVTPFEGQTKPFCNWTSTGPHWRSITATTAWTPLGAKWNTIKPHPFTGQVSTDFGLELSTEGSYCVRVRARDVDSTIFSGTVEGDWTYLMGGNALPQNYQGDDSPAFVFTGYPSKVTVPGCPYAPEYLGPADYLTPQRGVTTTRMPLFTWNPVPNMSSYFVIVAKDPQFHTIVDYAFTQVPAYAPRSFFASTTYQDESTAYYWVVLPAVKFDGGCAKGDVQGGWPASFHKGSIPAALMSPAPGADVVGQPTFRWTPREAARRYRLQIAQDPTFANPIDDITTDSTSYTSVGTYPADTVLYWRVRGEDDKLQPLVWSATGTFQKRLPTPVTVSPSPSSGDFTPTGRWQPVPGAVSYDIQVDQPDGAHPFFPGFKASAFTPLYVYGTGIWGWRVRAHFPRAGFGTVPGPYSSTVAFTRMIREPAGAATNADPDHVVLSWQPKMEGNGNGIKEYRVQVSMRPDFAQVVEDTTTENTTYAPVLTNFLYIAGGTFYWRVAAVDGGRNAGDFTAVQTFTLPKKSTNPQPPPPPPGKTPSRITAFVTKTATAVKVKGTVSPGHAGRRVTVTLFRKRGGAFVRIASKSPTLTRTSAYATSFRRQRGACKVTARFAGDADHLASARTVSFRC